MTIDEINQQLAALANCGDPQFAQAAQYVAQATAAAQAGQMSRAAAVIFIASERETRLAIGGATNGWKRVDFQVVLQIFHHSLQNNAEDAMADFDTLIDNIKNTLRASHNFGDSTQVNVWQGAEPVIDCIYGEPTTSDNGATETFAEIRFDVTQMIQA